MADVEVDLWKLRKGADRFDERAVQARVLADRFSAVAAPLLGGSPEAELLQAGESVQGIGDALGGLGQFCTGMADRIQQVAENYDRIDGAITEEAQQLNAGMA